MTFDPSKIRLPKKSRAREVDPERIFQSLTLRGTVENLWSPQGSALQSWFEKRLQSDVVVEMTTGGGKTLVGLLIAQSTVNELQRPVLCVCPTKQLVEQAAVRAQECGIEIATYMGGSWTEKAVFEACRGPCLTNYAALFNGKSIFRESELAGIIFDDAHVAGSIIRSQYTLKLANPSLVFTAIADLLRPIFHKNMLGQSFDDAVSGKPTCLLFVPMFEIRRVADQILAVLLKHDVAEGVDTKFAWEHLKDHLAHCVVLMSGGRIEISPVILPLHRSKTHSRASRRVYMTATLPSAAEFARTFGLIDFERITPKGKSGEAQRLFVLPTGEDDDAQREMTKDIIASRKAAIIVPSHHASGGWTDSANVFGGMGSASQAEIDKFAGATEPEKLVLVARYDGIDLPGNTCRVLIIDGIPRGADLLARFLDEGLQSLALRASSTATRVAQAVGRIFRSNTDHGVVLLCGTELQGWTRSPSNRAFLPPLLQKQLQLGISLRESVEKKQTTYDDLINALLAGDKKWDEFYSQRIEEFEIPGSNEDRSWLVDFATRERAAHHKLWDGNFQAAASDFSALADDSEKHERRMSAWYRHWEGLCCDLAGKGELATAAYARAANSWSELGRPKIGEHSKLKADAAPTPSSQAKAVARLWSEGGKRVGERLGQIAKNLVYGDRTNPVEEALRDLGELIGLVATRPDNDEHKGPDVLWRNEAKKSGVALEAKTNKEPTSLYQKKDDIAQVYDHIAYLEKKHPEDSFRVMIVGQLLSVSSDCHPPDGLRIVSLEQFHELTGRVRKLFEAMATTDTGEDVDVTAERSLRMFGLKWPECIDGLQSRLAVDLQRGNADSASVD